MSVKKILAALLTVMLIGAIFTGCEDKPVQQGSEWGLAVLPNIASTARAAENVFIGEIISVDKDKLIPMAGFSSYVEGVPVTVCVEEVFKGGYITGETVEITVLPEICNTVIRENDYKGRYAFCTGFENEKYRNLDIAIRAHGWDCVFSSDVDSEWGLLGVYGWEVLGNPFTVIKLNDDGTVSWCNTMYHFVTPHFFQEGSLKEENLHSQDEVHTAYYPEPIINTSITGSQLRSLYIELSDSLVLANSLRDLADKNITEIRMVNSPWAEIYNVSVNTEKEFTDRLIAGEEGYWASNGDTNYTFSQTETESAVRTEITSVTDEGVISAWKSAFKDYTGGHGHIVEENPCHLGYTCDKLVNSYIAIYVDDKPEMVLGYSDAYVMDEEWYMCSDLCEMKNPYQYSLYDVYTGSYIYIPSFPNAPANNYATDFRALVDLLEEKG